MQIDTAPSCLSRLRRIDNAHRDALMSYFGGLAQAGRAPREDVEYLFILFTNRCGSNFLAQLLASTDKFNEAGEYFNAATVIGNAHLHRLRSLPDYVDFLTSCVAVHGRLVVKMGIEHLGLLAEAGLLERMLPRTRFVLMERQDRLGQAISRAIASQNLRWTSRHDSRRTDEQLVYSRLLIRQDWEEINRCNYLLRYFLGELGAPALCVAYEDLLADPQAEVARIGTALGRPGLHIDPTRVRIARQTSAVNDAWRARYLSGR